MYAELAISLVDDSGSYLLKCDLYAYQKLKLQIYFIISTFAVLIATAENI